MAIIDVVYFNIKGFIRGTNKRVVNKNPLQQMISRVFQLHIIQSIFSVCVVHPTRLQERAEDSLREVSSSCDIVTYVADVLSTIVIIFV